MIQSNFCPNCGKSRSGAARFCDQCGHDFTSAGAIPQVPAEVPAESRRAASGVAAPSIGVMVGGALAVVGSFLPWVTASTVFGSLSRSGVDRGGDGWITLGAGAVIALLGLATMTRPNRAANLFIAIAAAVAFLVFILDFSDIQGRVSALESNSQGLALGGVGIGLWLVALGAVVAFVSSLLRRTSHKET